jgi:hypothetical protein
VKNAVKKESSPRSSRTGNGSQQAAVFLYKQNLFHACFDPQYLQESNFQGYTQPQEAHFLK